MAHTHTHMQIIKPMKEGRKPEYPEKTPGDELQKMPPRCTSLLA